MDDANPTATMQSDTLPRRGAWSRLLRDPSPVVATLGLLGTAGLFATGRTDQAWLGMVTVAVYVITARWRSAGHAVAILVVTLAPNVLSVPMTFPVLAGVLIASSTGLVDRRMVPDLRVAVSGVALVLWILVVLVAREPLDPADAARVPSVLLLCLLILLAVFATRGVSVRALLHTTLLAASVLGVIAAMTPGEKVYAWRHGALNLNPNYAGLVLAVGVVCAVAVALERRVRLAAAAAPGLILGLAVTQSRSAVIAAGVGIGVLLLARFGIPRTRRQRLVGIGVVLAGGLGLTVFSVLRSGAWAEVSNNQRQDLLGLAVRVAFENPILGVGWSNFPSISASETAAGLALNTHNDYLRLAAEGGLVCVCLFLVFVGSAIRRPSTPTRAALLAVVLAWFTGLAFVNALGTPAVSLAPLLLLGALAGSPAERPEPVRRLLEEMPQVMPGRVLICVGQLGMGGAERQIVLLAKGLVERGVDVHVASLRGGVRDAELKAVGARTSVLNPFRARFPIRGVPIAVASWRLYCILRRERPDVVHGYLLHTYILSSVIARLAGVPVVVTARRALGVDMHPVLVLGERLSNVLADAVVANAESVAEDSVTRENLRPDKVLTIHNAIPPLAAKETGAWFPGRALRLINVANLKEIKNQSLLLEAAAILDSRGVPVLLQVVGEGPMRPELEARAAELGVDMELLGLRSDVADLLHEADIYVHSSRGEGMSNAIMEAMAVGLPIVATDVGGTAELLGGCGVLVPSDVAEEMASAIESLATDPGEALRLGQSARARIRTEFSEEALATRHLNLYGGLMGGGRTSGPITRPRAERTRARSRD